MKVIKTIIGDKFVGRIYKDENPRYPFNEFEFLGRLYIPRNKPLQSTCNQAYFDDACVKVPIYSVSLDGISVHSIGFSSDCAQIGWICANGADILNWFSRVKLSNRLKDMAHNRLVDEVNTLNDWLTGEIYGYSIVRKEQFNDEDTFEDSCWGFYGLDWCVKCLEDEISEYDSRDSMKATTLRGEKC